MADLNELLARLDGRHRRALHWFAAHAGSRVPWPAPLSDGTFLVSRAKGIYKPAWSPLALSIRQVLNSPYADRHPVYRDDGTWSYTYAAETSGHNTNESLFTNQGLLACLQHRAPVGVLIQATGKPHVTYDVVGLALVVGHDSDFFSLEGFGPSGAIHLDDDDRTGHADAVGHELELESVDFANLVDERERLMKALIVRRGQSVFRRQLLEAYGGRCLITGCDVPDVLEAAHIIPYSGPRSSQLTNGLLLRSDLHVLFDLGLITINPESMTVITASSLAGTAYEQYGGVRLHLPESGARPDRGALAHHKEWAGL